MALTITKDSASAFTTSNTDLVSSCRLSDTKFAVIYKDITNSDCRVVVATISGTSITFGTSVQVYSGVIASCSIDKLDTDKIVVHYQINSDYNIYCKVATISGTTPSFGSAYGNYYSATESVRVVSYNTDYFALLYNERLVRGASVSGTVISFAAGASSLRSPAYVPFGGFFLDTDKIICYCGGSTASPRFFLVSFSGTTATVGTEDYFISGQTGQMNVDACCALSSSKILVYFHRANASRVVCATISGDAFTWGTIYEYSNTQYTTCSVRKVSDSKAILLNPELKNVGTLAISGTTITSNSDAADYESGYMPGGSADYLGNDYFQISFRDGGDSGKGKSIIGYGVAPVVANTSAFFQLF